MNPANVLRAYLQNNVVKCVIEMSENYYIAHMKKYIRDKILLFDSFELRIQKYLISYLILISNQSKFSCKCSNKNFQAI